MEEESKLFEKIIFIISIVLICLSISTYIKPLLELKSDFGIILEALSLILLIASGRYFIKEKIGDSLVCLKFSVGLIIVLFVYDIVSFVRYVQSVDSEILGFLGEEWIFIAYIILLIVLCFRLEKREKIKISRN